MAPERLEGARPGLHPDGPVQHGRPGQGLRPRRLARVRGEREEALRIAQAVFEENKRLKGSVNQGQNALLEQAKRVIHTEIEDAKRIYKEAYESGDSDKL